MELFVSEPSKPLDLCLEQVQLSDAVILIIGFMAGSLIPESPELTDTRAEFELAQRLGRPVFAFLKTEGGVPVNKETDADKKKALDDFKNAVTWRRERLAGPIERHGGKLHIQNIKGNDGDRKAYPHATLTRCTKKGH